MALPGGLRFVVAVRDNEGGTKRLVFEKTSGVAVVVKHFGSDRPTTVKIWDLSNSSLAKTMSYWSTKEEYVPSPDEKRESLEVIGRLVGIVAAR